MLPAARYHCPYRHLPGGHRIASGPPPYLCNNIEVCNPPLYTHMAGRMSLTCPIRTLVRQCSVAEPCLEIAVQFSDAYDGQHGLSLCHTCRARRAAAATAAEAGDSSNSRALSPAKAAFTVLDIAEAPATKHVPTAWERLATCLVGLCGLSGVTPLSWTDLKTMLIK